MFGKILRGLEGFGKVGGHSGSFPIIKHFVLERMRMKGYQVEKR
jgi:hypothetical protein